MAQNVRDKVYQFLHGLRPHRDTAQRLRVAFLVSWHRLMSRECQSGIRDSIVTMVFPVVQYGIIYLYFEARSGSKLIKTGAFHGMVCLLADSNPDLFYSAVGEVGYTEFCRGTIVHAHASFCSHGQSITIMHGQ